MRSKIVPHRCLLDADDTPLHRYDYYVRLRTHSAWRIPLLHGRCPPVPDETATPKEKGVYALFLMLLFRPHRGVEDLVGAILQRAPEVTSEDAMWKYVHEAFLRWRHFDIEVPAKRVLQGSTSAGGQRSATVMPFDSAPWWAVMI